MGCFGVAAALDQHGSSGLLLCSGGRLSVYVAFDSFVDVAACYYCVEGGVPEVVFVPNDGG